MFNKFNSYLKNNLWLRTSLIIAALLMLGGVFVLGIFSNFGFLLARATPFPVNLHSAEQANYSKDPEFMQIPPMDIQIVIDAIWDLNLSSQNLSLRLTQVNDNFISTIASVTPQPTFTNIPVTLTVDPYSSLESTPINSETPGGSTDISPSFTPTQTPIGFVASATFTETASPPTNTSAPPTNTSAPPTNTAAPPTNTVSPCGQLSLSGYTRATKKVSWNLVNNSSSLVTISSISLSWPSENESIDKIFYGTGKIWDGSGVPPSINISSGWDGSSRDLAGGSSKIIEFTFIQQSASTGYSLGINFSNGCSVSKSN